MSPLRRPWALIVPLLFVIPSGASAQMKAGAWTGTVTPPDNPVVDATFDVRVSGDTTHITIKVEFGDFPAHDVKVLDDRVTFTFEPGVPVNCVLMLQENGNYSGDCTDPNGEIGVIVMVPPEGTPESSRPRPRPERR